MNANLPEEAALGPWTEESKDDPLVKYRADLPRIFDEMSARGELSADPHELSQLAEQAITHRSSETQQLVDSLAESSGHAESASASIYNAYNQDTEESTSVTSDEESGSSQTSHKHHRFLMQQPARPSVAAKPAAPTPVSAPKPLVAVAGSKIRRTVDANGKVKEELDDTEDMLASLRLTVFVGTIESYVNDNPDLVDVALRSDGDDLLKIAIEAKGTKLLPVVGRRVRLRARQQSAGELGSILTVYSFDILKDTD